jgi:hypothetical protein
MSARAPIVATSIGPIAADLLRSADQIEVVAIFDRSAYLMTSNGLIVIGIEAVGPGPINILVPPARDGRPPWHGLLADGMTGRVQPQELHIGADVVLSLARAPVWRPAPWPSWNPTAVRAGLAWLHASSAEACPLDGLSPLVFAPARKLTHTGQAARDLIRRLRVDLAAALRHDAWSADGRMTATLLLGLGPGLTPSGDDVLGGVMLALTSAGRIRLRDALWDALVDELGELTVPVSAMHLSAAADGLSHRDVHAFIGAWLANDVAAFTAATSTLATLGATSGWDTMAGIALAMDALIA